MNGYERIVGLLSGSEIDRTPNMPITMMHAADVLGIPYGKYVTDYRLLVEGQLKTAELYGIDHVSVISDPGREAADLGADVRFFDDGPPAIVESNALLSDTSRLDSLQMVDPKDKPEGRMADRVRATELFAQKVKGQYFIEGWVEGPCAEGADLRGINHLMMDFMTQPEFVTRLFEFTTAQGILFAKAQIEAGADIIGVGDAAASLVGPKIYRKFVYQYEKRLIDGIHELGGRVRLHICGNISKILPEVGMLKADMVDLDSMVSVSVARTAMGEDQILTGNINPVTVLRNGTPDDIVRELLACREAAGKNYIFAAGCEVPRDTPKENVLALTTLR